jgi:hypothetical protein
MTHNRSNPNPQIMIKDHLPIKAQMRHLLLTNYHLSAINHKVKLVKLKLEVKKVKTRRNIVKKINFYCFKLSLFHIL